MASASAASTMPGLGQHGDMGERAGDVLGGERWSKSMEALISSMIAAGPLANRPPHILLLMLKVL